MAHEVETMAYAGKVPWHGLGVQVSDNMTPDEMLVAAQLDWTVSKRPAYTIDTPFWTEDSQPIPVPGSHFIVRDTDNKKLSHCGDDYEPFQNHDTFQFFKKFVSVGDMKMETAGSLRDGENIWGLAKIETSFELAGGDKIEGYLLLNSPHVAGKALTIMFTPIRVVCANTMAMALNTDGKSFRVLHLQAFDDEIMAAAEEALGISEVKMNEFKEQTDFLSSKKALPIETQNFIAELFQPQLLIERGKMEVANDIPLIDEFNKTSEQVHEAINLSPGAEFASAKGTWWGALNGVTYVLDHEKRETERIAGGALHSGWFGQNANVKRKALSLATKYAEAA